jgi:hypothetical protein
MKSAVVVLISLFGILTESSAFVAPGLLQVSQKRLLAQPLFSSTKDKEKTESKNAAEGGQVTGEVTPDPDAEGLPWWWELVWDLDIMKKGEAGKPIQFGDSANVLRTNIEQIYGGYPSLDGCPLAGTISSMIWYLGE